MNWTPLQESENLKWQEEVPSSSPRLGSKADARLGSCRPETRSPRRRALSDISNSVIGSGRLGLEGQGGGGAPGLEGRRRARPEPKVPARHSEPFAIFDDSAGGPCTPRAAAAAPPQLPPEVQDTALPDIGTFAEPMDEEEQYRRAMLLDGGDGFGSAEELAGALLRTTGQECMEYYAQRPLHWGPVDLPDEDACGRSPDADMRVWPTNLTPQRSSDPGGHGFPPLRSPPLHSLLADSDAGSPAFSPLRLPSPPSARMDCDEDPSSWHARTSRLLH